MLSYNDSDIAKDYEERHGKAFEELVNHVRSLKDFIGADWVSEDDEKPTKEVRLLDYACGTGLISRVRVMHLASSFSHPPKKGGKAPNLSSLLNMANQKNITPL